MAKKWRFVPPFVPPLCLRYPPKSPQNQAIRHPQQATSPGKLFLHLLPNAHTVTDHQRQPHQHRQRVSAMATPFGLVPSACQLSIVLWIVESCPQILCITPTSHVPTKNPAHGRAGGGWCRQWLPHAVTQVARLRRPHTAPAPPRTAAQCLTLMRFDQRPCTWGIASGVPATPLMPHATVHQSGTRHPA